MDNFIEADYTVNKRLEKENGDEEMIYSCEEHVDQALDDVVKQTETAPVFEKLENVENTQNSCGYCGKLAAYMVANE